MLSVISIAIITIYIIIIITTTTVTITMTIYYSSRPSAGAPSATSAAPCTRQKLIHIHQSIFTVSNLNKGILCSK